MLFQVNAANEVEVLALPENPSPSQIVTAMPVQFVLEAMTLQQAWQRAIELCLDAWETSDQIGEGGALPRSAIKSLAHGSASHGVIEFYITNANGDREEFGAASVDKISIL